LGEIEIGGRILLKEIIEVDLNGRARGGLVGGVL
jgi:hypothetical protein